MSEQLLRRIIRRLPRYRQLRIGWLYLREFRGTAALTLVLILLTSVFEGLSLGLLIPLLETLGASKAADSGLAAAVDRAFAWFGLPKTFLSVMLLFGALSLMKYALSSVADYQARVLSSSLKYSMRSKVFDNLMTAPLSYFYTRPVGGLVSGAYVSTDEAAALAENGVRLITAVVMTTMYIALQFAISPTLTLFAALCVVASYFFVARRFSISYSQGEEAKDLIDQSVAYLQNRLSGIKTIKAFGNEGLHAREYDDLINRLRQVALEVQWNKIIANLFGEPFTTVVVLFLLIFAVQSLQLGITELVAFFYAYSMLVPRVKAVNTEILTLTEKMPHFERVHELIDRGNVSYLMSGTAPLDVISGDIVFDDVVYAYPNTGVPVLRGVDFRIKHGQMTALVGGSGAGKTTIIDLLLRLHDPDAGRIVVGDVPLRDVRPGDWHRHIGIVDQDAYLFTGTIDTNIRYGSPDATHDEIVRAAKLAHADSFIRKLSHGYDTVVGERGTTLSGGQRQRLALARALVRDPQLLVLDEATSALDSESERLIQRALAELRRTRTVVVIAHRLSTIASADHIVILEEGRVREEGTHVQLMALQGLYYRYQQLQTLPGEAVELNLAPGGN